jgi:hypothetical protein
MSLPSPPAVFLGKEQTVTPSRPDHRHSIGLTRREALQVGYSGLLGIGLSSVLAGRAQAAKSNRKPKSMILVFLTGAASHIDTFDMKPDAPDEIRGEFKPIATKVPGLHICEHLQRLAARADKYALVRSLSHRENNHLVATHHVLTGNQQPGAFFDKVASRDDWPSYSSTLHYFNPRADGLPSGVNLPTFLVEGPLTWPGQHAGFLGPRHDPWQITRDPNSASFRVDNLSLPNGFDVGRLNDRRTLLEQVDKQQGQLAQLAESRRLSNQQETAFNILTSGKLSQEPPWAAITGPHASSASLPARVSVPARSSASPTRLEVTPSRSRIRRTMWAPRSIISSASIPPPKSATASAARCGSIRDK